MISVDITIALKRTELSEEALTLAAHELLDALDQQAIGHLTFNKVTPPAIAISVRPDVLDGRHVAGFIEAIVQFVKKYGDRMRLELNYAGNRVRVDELSLHRVEADIRRLTQRSFSVSEGNIVIGSNNEISPTEAWPRRKD